MRWIEIHRFLNGMWGGIVEARETIQDLLAGTDFKVEEIEEVFGGYVYVEEKWEKMNYPYPAFEIKPGGEVGITPQGPYFVFVVPVEELSKSLLNEFIQNFKRAFVYGYQDFLKDFYSPQKSNANVLEEIIKSREPAVQLEADFESWNELFEGLLMMVELLKRHRVKWST